MPLDADLGSFSNETNSTTIALTTSAAAAVGTRIVLTVNDFNAGAVLSSVSGGGLTWVVDRTQDDSGDCVGIASADAPAGLASGTTITATLALSGTDRIITAASFTGLVGGASGYVDTTAANVNASGTGWTSGNVVTAGGALVFTCASGDNVIAGTTNAPTAPSAEIHDLREAGGLIVATEYRIETSAGTFTNAGTWSNAASSKTVAVTVAYKLSTPYPLRSQYLDYDYSRGS